MTTFRCPLITSSLFTFNQNAIGEMLKHCDARGWPKEEHVAKALSKCGYPPWTIDRVKQDIVEKSLLWKMKQRKQRTLEANTKVWLSCHVKGLSEAFAKILKSHGIAIANRPHRTLQNFVVHLKDKVKDKEKPEMNWNKQKTAKSQRLKIYVQNVHHSREHMNSNDHATAQSLPWWWCGPAASTRSADVLSTPSHHGSANGRPSLEGYPWCCSPPDSNLANWVATSL